MASTKMTSCGSITSEDLLVTTVDQHSWCKVTPAWYSHCSGAAALWFPCLGDPAQCKSVADLPAQGVMSRSDTARDRLNNGIQ